tara:strand:- start:710 stop:907 length:198 start_codon:yes stop_codon:yes gene_type:complete
MSQLSLFENTRRTTEDLLDKYVDYSDLGKTQAMERDLDLLTDFINEYSETMLPLLESYLRNKANG